MAGRRAFNELAMGFSPGRKTRVVARVSQLKADLQRSQEDPTRELNVGPDWAGGPRKCASGIAGTNDLRTSHAIVAAKGTSARNPT
jgi:hypothetical protein